MAIAAGVGYDARDPSRDGTAIGLALLQGVQLGFCHKVEVTPC